MESAEEGDDLAAAGGTAGQLDRRLHRLGAAVAEEHRVEAGGGDAHQGLGGRDELGMVGGARDVPEPVDLLAHRAHHHGVAVAEVGDPDAAGEVEHRPSVEGVQPRSSAVSTTRSLDRPKAGDISSRSFSRRVAMDRRLSTVG